MFWYFDAPSWWWKEVEVTVIVASWCALDTIKNFKTFVLQSDFSLGWHNNTRSFPGRVERLKIICFKKLSNSNSNHLHFNHFALKL